MPHGKTARSREREKTGTPSKDEPADTPRMPTPNLHKFGFKVISAAEAERAKRREASKLSKRDAAPYDVHIDLSTETPMTTLIPKKKKPVTTPKGPAPVPRKVGSTASKVASTANSWSKKKTTVKQEGDYSAAAVRAIKRRHERELARAVVKAHMNHHKEEAMQRRIHASQHGKPQKYRKRLRKAIYFDDSSSSERERAPGQVGTESSDDESVDTRIWTAEPKASGQKDEQPLHDEDDPSTMLEKASPEDDDRVSSDSVDREVWTNEPRSNNDEVVQLLRRQVEEGKRENAKLRSRLEYFMSRMERALSSGTFADTGDSPTTNADQPSVPPK